MATEIVFDKISKSFGSVTAVDELSFVVAPGLVTGFLGPNGAGKTTTLRMLLGLVEPTSGTATVGGRRYLEIERPAAVVGAALEASSFHPGRTGREHLRAYAPQLGVGTARCDEVLELVGLADAAGRRVSGYSLGMRQRLGLAFTLLGDPQVLVLDEPANGLDPQGIHWLRTLLRYLASEGRTVLVSSHVLSEVQQTVDDVVIIAEGRLVHASSLTELASLARKRVLVATPDPTRLMQIAAERRWQLDQGPEGFTVWDVEPSEVGAVAFAHGLELHELRGRTIDLEQVFLDLTGQSSAVGA